MKDKKIKLATVSHTIWAFYEAFSVDDKDTMADWFETLLQHYQDRGRKLKEYHKTSKNLIG